MTAQIPANRRRKRPKSRALCSWLPVGGVVRLGDMMYICTVQYSEALFRCKMQEYVQGALLQMGGPYQCDSGSRNMRLIRAIPVQAPDLFIFERSFSPSSVYHGHVILLHALHDTKVARLFERFGAAPLLAELVACVFQMRAQVSFCSLVVFGSLRGSPRALNFTTSKRQMGPLWSRKTVNALLRTFSYYWFCSPYSLSLS